MRFLDAAIAWISSTEFSMWIGRSHNRIAWLFTFHLFGLVLLLGGVVFLSLRLLGLMMSQSPASRLARAVLPILTAGLVLMIASGLLIFIGGAQNYYIGFWFRLKMMLLLAALMYHFGVFRRLALTAEDRSRWTLRGAAVVELLIWVSVGCSGRAIAFF